MPLGPLGNLSGGLGGLPLPLPLDMGEALAQVQANSLQLGALAGMMPGEGGAGGPSLDALNTLNLQLMAATQLARHTNQVRASSGAGKQADAAGPMGMQHLVFGGTYRGLRLGC